MKENERLSILITILLIEAILTTISYIDFRSINRYLSSIKVQELNNSTDLEIKMVNNSIFRNLTSSLSDEREKMIIDDINNKQKPEARYANITPDKKINWKTYYDSYTYYESPITFKMFENISLDGKKVSFPLSLKDFGEEYAEMENVDYQKLSNIVLPLSIKDTRNNVTFIPYAINDTNKVSKMGDFFKIHVETIKGKASELPYEINNIYPVRMTILKDDKYLMDGEINPRTKKIISLSTDFSHELIGPKDLRIYGIGIGNTFNEMYEKFGRPSYANQEGDTAIYYNFIDTLGNSYYITFIHSNEIFLDTEYKKTKPNVITGLGIYFKENL